MSKPSHSGRILTKIRRNPEKWSSHTHCPVCRNEYTDVSLSETDPVKYQLSTRRISRDHILPKCRRTPDFLKLCNINGVNNIRYMCAGCNSKRGNFNHCVAALILHRFTRGDTSFYDGYRK